MNKTMQHAIAAAFVATAELQRKLKALGKSTTNGKQFQTEAAKCVAVEASKQYKLEIVAYDGQRGIAFGVVEGEKEDGTPKYRTRQAAEDNTRKWFQRNIGQKNGKKGKAKPQGVWGQIVKDMTAIRELKADLDDDQRRAFHKALVSLIKKFK